MKPSQWPTFSAEYRHPDGGTYTFHFPAEDHADAALRLRAIKGNAELLGQIMATVPAIPGAGWLVRLRCWIGNLGK